MRIKTGNDIERLLEASKGAYYISGVAEGRIAPVIQAIAEKGKRQCLVITASYARARKLAEDISFFAGNKKTYVIPSEEQIFFKYEAKSHTYLEERLQAIIAILKGEDCIVITPVFGAIQKMPPKDAFTAHVLRIKPGDHIEVDQIKRALSYMGYERAAAVEAKGQFGVRGGIVDVYPPDANHPYRIELFDTEVDSIRSFDSFTQRSIENKKSIASILLN
jgi:transcription-repair coupling factor (superfamily II helicase)